MQQQIAVVTIGIDDLPRSKRFYGEGFGWRPVFENVEIVFYQMNGLILGTWLNTALCEDMQRPSSGDVRARIALAHNVQAKADVEPLMDALLAAGGSLLRAADAPTHGGYRGYVADPDGHAWEIAWNPAWLINEQGHVTFKA
jgi:catechol 2,3-dioxygenase-like lactoylglutathione lyase family enzyme